MQSRKYLTLAISIVLVLGIFLGVLWIYTAQQRLAVYNLRSYDRFGLKAAALLIEKAGFRLNEIHSLPEKHPGTLIILTSGPIPKREWGRLKEWVRSGGAIVELAQAEAILDQSSPNTGYFKFSGARNCLSHNNALKNVPYYPKNDRIVGRSHPDEGYYSLDNHSYFIYRIRSGNGNIIVWNDLEGLTNYYLKRHPDNAVALVLLLKTWSTSNQLSVYNLTDVGIAPGTVRFKWKTSDLFNRYWGALFLLLAAICLLLWKTASRFGRPRPIQLAQGRSYHEFVASLAHLFQLARLQGAVLENLWRALLLTASQATGLAESTDLNVLEEKLKALTGKDYHLALLQKEAAQIVGVPSRARERSFLAMAQTLDTCRRELIAWKKSSNW